MARKLLADPDLPNKLAEGRLQDVRPCIYCYTCVGSIFLNRATCCAVNPATGCEAEFGIDPVERPRRVLVVGGGPAGMEAARVAALRGHRVTLCESRDRLGGTLLFSSLVYEVNGKLAEWLEAQVRSLPIDLRLGRKVTPELVNELSPEVVLVAVGARREPPAIPGVDRKNVLGGDDLRSLMTGGDGDGAAAHKLSTGQRALVGVGNLLGISERIGLARELTRRWMPLGKRVAVVGGGLVGVELAEFLVERGREVAVLEESKSFAAEMAPPRRWRVLHGLREHGVRLLSGVQVQAIEERGVVFAGDDGESHVLETDSVIVATGVQENTKLSEAIASLGLEVHALGDCSGVGYIQGAMLDAACVARAI
jgi:NADPH-dependent 2,4-dienoyl-CoA reductase/sulfur reductase-like enzyme